MFLLLLFPLTLNAEYTDSCHYYAETLWSAAGRYELAKSSFEASCNPSFGYNKDNEILCGNFGFEREVYETAKRNLEDAINNVATYCGCCDGLLDLLTRKSEKEIKRLELEINKLKSKIIELKVENKRIKLTQ